ncbi:hypothetical protein ACFUT3_31570, partial [Streptomyces cinereoruber]
AHTPELRNRTAPGSGASRSGEHLLSVLADKANEARSTGAAMADRTAWRICRDNRWWSVFGKKRAKRVDWTASPAKRPSLCEDCDQRFEDLDRAWGVSPRQEERDQEQEQDQAVPEQKTTGWLSCLRR